MKNPQATTKPAQTVWARRDVLGMMLGSALGLMGCGGGSSAVAGVSSGGTGSFTTGSIVGFGSIIVNGVRYDDTGAQVGDLDGADHTGVNALKLGMVVAVQGSAPMAATTGLNYTSEATATQIVFMTELLGPVAALDTTEQTFSVLGQAVRWSATTVVDGRVNTAAGLVNGDEVEIYGVWDGAAWQATRIEVLTTAATTYRLNGEVSALDTRTQTLMVGEQAVNYVGLSLEPQIVNGSRVRVTVNTTLTGSGDWQAQSLRLADWSATPLVGWSGSDLDGHDAEVEGVISGLVGSRFSLQGVVVEGSAIASSGLLANGARVEVKGQFANGVLVATRIEGDEDSDRESKGFELHGVVSGLTANTFVLRGFTVRYDGQTQGASVLSNGAAVEAKLALQPDGSWLALEVELDDHASGSGSPNDDDGDGDDSEDDTDSD
jgi:hypothetical protein